MNMEVESLKNYIIVKTSNVNPFDVSDVRVLSMNLGNGVFALWSDEEQSILAFAFDPALFDKGKAQKWVQETELKANASSKLYSFCSILSATSEDVTKGWDKSLLWKEILHPGLWFKTNTGKKMVVTPEVVNEVYKAFRAGLPRYVSVPADNHHGETGGVVPPEMNRGFVRDLKVHKGRLYGGFAITDPRVVQGVLRGSIADVSVYVQPNVIHPETGKKHKWVLRHVLLTNDPLIQDLAGWGVIAASGEDDELNEVECFTSIEDMEGYPMGFDQSEILEFERFKALGLSANEVESLVANAQNYAKKVRDLEIRSIVSALQGESEHSGVKQIEGYRHYPVVADAVEKALRALPESIALSADDDGHTDVDNAILDVLNAIPKEGRMKIGVQPSVRKSFEFSAGEGEGYSEEDLEEFIERL